VFLEVLRVPIIKRIIVEGWPSKSGIGRGEGLARREEERKAG